MESGNRSRFKKELSSLTNTLIDAVTDAVLYVSFNFLTTAGARTIGQVDYGMYQADSLLCRYNSKTIRKTLENLVSQKRLQRKMTQRKSSWVITQAGIKRIHEIIPTYKEKRQWDGYLYLISYDIPATSNPHRDLLRKYLRKIGCGKLQDSLWMTPYNSMGIVDEFVGDHSIPGTILISKLGKDGAIGDEDRKTLIARVYGYERLAKRYEEFIETYKNQKHPLKTQLSLDYHTILKDDPQLPFALEPDNFPAKKAHRVFQSLFSS